MVLTGHISSQSMQAISQGRSTAMVSKGLMKGSGCGQMATQAPQLMQAFQPMSNKTGGRSVMVQIFLYSDSGLK